MNTIKIYSQNIGMEFSTEKYAVLIIKKKKRKTEDIEYPNQESV